MADILIFLSDQRGLAGFGFEDEVDVSFFKDAAPIALKKAKWSLDTIKTVYGNKKYKLKLNFTIDNNQIDDEANSILIRPQFASCDHLGHIFVGDLGVLIFNWAKSHAAFRLSRGVLFINGDLWY